MPAPCSQSLSRLPFKQYINPVDLMLYSPDLSLVEHLWDELFRRKEHQNARSTLNQLGTASLEEWNNIPMRRINATLHAEENSDCDRCMSARGWHTRYWGCSLIPGTCTVPSIVLQLHINYQSKSNEICWLMMGCYTYIKYCLEQLKIYNLNSNDLKCLPCISFCP